MRKAVKFVGKAMLVFIIAHTLLVFILWPWYSKFGATKAEAAMALPGDETQPAGALIYTRGITIGAPPELVWPWITQLGQGRGGMYSYEFLENLVGCNMQNVDVILPEEKHLKVGDGMVLHPKGLTLPITAMKDREYMVTGDGGWSFHLLPQPDGTTRLLTRGRSAYTGVGYALDRLLLQPIAFLMDQKMLRGIQDRAEALARTY